MRVLFDWTLKDPQGNLVKKDGNVNPAVYCHRFMRLQDWAWTKKMAAGHQCSIRRLSQGKGFNNKVSGSFVAFWPIACITYKVSLPSKNADLHAISWLVLWTFEGLMSWTWFLEKTLAMSCASYRSRWHTAYRPWTCPVPEVGMAMGWLLDVALKWPMIGAFWVISGFFWTQ